LANHKFIILHNFYAGPTCGLEVSVASELLLLYGAKVVAVIEAYFENFGEAGVYFGNVHFVEIELSLDKFVDQARDHVLLLLHLVRAGVECLIMS